MTSVDLGDVGAHHDVIHAHSEKIRQGDKSFCGWYAGSVFEFGEQRLFDAGGYLQLELRDAPLLSESSEIVLHTTRIFYHTSKR